MEATPPVLVTVAATVAVLYMVFHYASDRVVANRLFGARATEDEERTQAAFWRRRLGFLLLGAVPLTVMVVAMPGTPSSYGARFGDPLWTTLLALGAYAITVPGILLGARKPWFTRCYPEVRHTTWTPRRFVASALSWGVYLLGYEFFFRAFLLFGLLHTVGYWPAVALSTGFYAYAHLNKNAGEGLGTLLMGVVYALIALETGSFLTSFIAHWLTAVTSDRVAVGANKAMHRAASRS